MTKKLRNESEKYRKNDKINRIFSERFKREKVGLIMQKKLSIQQCCNLYQVSRTTVSRWLEQYSPDYGKGTKMVVQLESEALQTLALQERVLELERAVGQKQMELDYLHRLLAVASEELGYDVKKKYAPAHSNGFDSTLRSIATA